MLNIKDEDFDPEKFMPVGKPPKTPEKTTIKVPEKKAEEPLQVKGEAVKKTDIPEASDAVSSKSKTEETAASKK